MKPYRKIFALFSIAIIYALVSINIEFTIWELILWIIGVVCYAIAFNGEEDDD